MPVELTRFGRYFSLSTLREALEGRFYAYRNSSFTTTTSAAKQYTEVFANLLHYMHCKGLNSNHGVYSSICDHDDHDFEFGGVHKFHGLFSVYHTMAFLFCVSSACEALALHFSLPSHAEAIVVRTTVRAHASVLLAGYAWMKVRTAVILRALSGL